MPDQTAPNTPVQNIPIPPEIQAFLESLIQEANVPIFDDKAKDELIRYLFDKLDKFLAAKIVENMKPEDTEEFIKLNEKGAPREEIDEFIKAHMQNPQEVFTKAFIDFRDFYLTGQPGAGQTAAPAKPAAPTDSAVPAATPMPAASTDDAATPASDTPMDEKMVN